MTNVSGVNSSVDYGQISSGKRINKAADDAAGLAIAKNMEKEATGLEVGASNAKDGISLTNIADGALSNISDSLNRVKELSVKAMNGINSGSQLSAIQKEIDSLMQGIEQTAKGTEFNSMKLLDGSMADISIATNPDGSGMKIQMENATLDALGIKGYNVTGKFDMSVIDDAISKVSEARSNLGASANALSSAYSYNTGASIEQTGAQSKIEDLDMAKAISEKKKEEVLGEYKNIMQKKQMEQEAMLTKFF